MREKSEKEDVVAEEVIIDNADEKSSEITIIEEEKEKTGTTPKEIKTVEKKEHVPSDDEVYDPKLEQKEQKKQKKKTEKEFSKVKSHKSSQELEKSKKKKKIIIIILIILLIAGIAAAVYFIFFFNKKPEETTPEPEPVEVAPRYYSKLTGLQIENEGENLLPTYCIQIPNGADGARPQTGLNEAGVVFEAIAEAGITRFAAIFQNPKTSVIGPIRSLRTYYLDWDTPFDCTIVHAGGSLEAAQALASGGYRDLNESYSYMWRDYTSYWAPNNLMTSPTLLAKFNEDNGFTSSNLTAFPRLTPDENKQVLGENRKNAGLAEDPSVDQNSDNQSDGYHNEKEGTAVPLVKNISVNFGYEPTFNTSYQYDEQTNTYLRSYASGEPHLSYSCVDVAKDEPSPKPDCGMPKQLSPSAIAVMMVDEYLDSDNYHHVINTIGMGVAYIFQNGSAVKGTWNKDAKSSQIIFKDETGKTISFAPGQLWIAAVPNSSGSVNY